MAPLSCGRFQRKKGPEGPSHRCGSKAQKGSPGNSTVFSTCTDLRALGSSPSACRVVTATCDVATGVFNTPAFRLGFETISPTLVSPKLNPPCSAFFLVEPV